MELFREASPAKDLRTEFARRISGLTGPMVEIAEDEPEVVRVKGTVGLAKKEPASIVDCVIEHLSKDF